MEENNISIPIKAQVALDRGKESEAIEIVREAYDLDLPTATAIVDEYTKTRYGTTSSPLVEETGRFFPIVLAIVIAVAAMLFFFNR